MLPGITPSNTYVCADGKFMVIGANGDAIFKRLMYAMGREDIAEDPRFENNAKRSEHAEFLDNLIEEWTKSLPFEVAKECLDKAGVPAGSIYSVEDIVNDPHYQARNMIQEVAVDGLGMLKMPGIMPKMSETPGEIEWAGPKLGQHTEAVLSGKLRLTEEQIKDLKVKGII
jgi:crotonobetainyl-CoA:carnitine CoA-transferase CaiB-like acyl-CoA transferase